MVAASASRGGGAMRQRGASTRGQQRRAAPGRAVAHTRPPRPVLQVSGAQIW
jgi:hypothetical protein